MREYTYKLLMRFRPEEQEAIKRRMKEAGISNMTAYIRKMAVDGLVIQMDLSDLKEISRLLHINSNNLNQYVKRANETGNIYVEDIKELKEQQKEILKLMEKFYLKLSSID